MEEDEIPRFSKLLAVKLSLHLPLEVQSGF